MTYCPACRSIRKGDYDSPECVFVTPCQECGRYNRVIQQEYYDNIPRKEVRK